MEIKLRYKRIDQVIKEVGVPKSTIRYWCEVFKINPKRSKINYRMFTEADIKKLRYIIHLLKVEKLTIEGAKLKIYRTQWNIKQKEYERS